MVGCWALAIIAEVPNDLRTQAIENNHILRDGMNLAFCKKNHPTEDGKIPEKQILVSSPFLDLCLFVGT